MNSNNYSPLQSGVRLGQHKDIYYMESKPQGLSAEIVHRFWTLKTLQQLDKDFVYTIMPDACIDFVFDVTETVPPIIMTPTVSIEALNLGKTFHYVGIRFKPGVLTNAINISSVIGNQKNLESMLTEKVGMYDMNLDSKQVEGAHYELLETFVRKLIGARIVERNDFIENVLRGMQYGLTVDEVANKVGYSSRQLQRKVLKQTGFSPIQLRRIIRFQSVLSTGDYVLRFADQSHLIKEFKNVTGVSYAHFADQFINVRKVQS